MSIELHNNLITMKPSKEELKSHWFLSFTQQLQSITSLKNPLLDADYTCFIYRLEKEEVFGSVINGIEQEIARINVYYLEWYKYQMVYYFYLDYSYIQWNGSLRVV